MTGDRAPSAAHPVSPNAALIGQPGGRNRLATPVLVLDRDILDANLAKMQALCTAAGIALRPHGKAHKCSTLARAQIAAGAVGLCVATPGEAEAFADAGIDNLLLTSTFASDVACARVVAVAARSPGFTCVFDHAEVARKVARLARERGITLRVLLDLDMGRHRAGVAGAEAVEALARVLLAEEGLELIGLQAYAGHLSHMRSLQDRRDGARDAAERVAAARITLKDRLDWVPSRVTGCSTGGSALEWAAGAYTEAQVGSYALMDTEYGAVESWDGEAWPFKPSLFLAMSVTSANHPGMVTTDGGEKRLASKYGVAPQLVRGAAPDATFRPNSDEHGTIQAGPSGRLPALGAVVEAVIPHCDPTVNLHDFLHVVRGDVVEDIWPIDARGR